MSANYGRKFPGSGSVPPYRSMGSSRAPWNPDNMVDVEIVEEKPRDGTVGAVLDAILGTPVETRIERRYVR